MTDPSDLTNEELDRIVRRLHLAFQRRPLLPMQSLQYRLGETGHPRIHSYALKRALGVLGRKLTSRGDQGISHRPWMVAPSVFASGDLDKDAATSLLREQEEHLGALANCDLRGGIRLCRAFRFAGGSRRIPLFPALFIRPVPSWTRWRTQQPSRF